MIGEKTYTVQIAGPRAPMPSGLIAWYRGEGNALGLDGVQNGTIVGSVGFAAGKVGQAFSFNGSNRFVALPNNLFPFPFTGNGTAPFSFELWFQTSDDGVILGQQNATPYGVVTSSVPAIYVGTDGRLRVEMFWEGANAPFTSASPVNDGYFHHLAVTFDGTAQRIYLDNTLISNLAHAQLGFTTTYRYQLGTGYTGSWPAGLSGWFNFNGLLDEPAIYNRALTATEVSQIFAAGNLGKSPIPKIISVTRPGTTVHLVLHGDPTARYQLQRTASLLIPFTDFGTPQTANATGDIDLTDNLGPTPPPQLFYRAYQVP